METDEKAKRPPLSFPGILSGNEQDYRFFNAAETLYWRAEEARRLGVSYRNFLVGCAAWVFYPSATLPGDRWRVFLGANSKIAPDRRNICAEPVAVNSASYTSSDAWIVGLVVIGETQEDERGLTPPTLRPCRECRALLARHPMMRPETYIITARPPVTETSTLEEAIHETWSLETLLREYDSFPSP